MKIYRALLGAIACFGGGVAVTLALHADFYAVDWIQRLAQIAPALNLCLLVWLLRVLHQYLAHHDAQQRERDLGVDRRDLGVDRRDAGADRRDAALARREHP